MIELHERHHGCKPTHASALLMGNDLLACVLEGVYTEVEKAMIELERGVSVKEIRRRFHGALQHKLIDCIERLSGRRVVAVIPSHHIDPDLEVSVFVL